MEFIFVGPRKYVRTHQVLITAGVFKGQSATRLESKHDPQRSPVFELPNCVLNLPDTHYVELTMQSEIGPK